MAKAKKIDPITAIYEDLIDAYIKFKSYIYHENFSVNIKIELAKFERTHKTKLRKLAEELYVLSNKG